MAQARSDADSPVTHKSFPWAARSGQAPSLLRLDNYAFAVARVMLPPSKKRALAERPDSRCKQVHDRDRRCRQSDPGERELCASVGPEAPCGADANAEREREQQNAADSASRPLGVFRELLSATKLNRTDARSGRTPR